MPNGVHAVALDADPLVHLELYRYETSCDLLITCHWLHRDVKPSRPKLWNEILFSARHGVIELELWGKNKRFRGGMSPRFLGRNGGEISGPESFKQPVFKMVEAVTDIGCRQSHLLQEPDYQPTPRVVTRHERHKFPFRSTPRDT